MLGVLKALRTTVRHLPRKPVTVQYPEVREALPERSRGLFKVVVDVTTQEARCRACTLCETNCPVQVIRVDYRSTYDLPAVDEAGLARNRLEEQGVVDLAPLTPVIGQHLECGTTLTSALEAVQDVYGYLPRAALEHFARQTGASLSEVYGVAGSCEHLRLAPFGKQVLQVCLGTACYAAGAPLVMASLQDALGVADGGTTADGLFTLRGVDCLGTCGPAPVVRVGDELFTDMTPEKARRLIVELRARAEGA